MTPPSIYDSVTRSVPVRAEGVFEIFRSSIRLRLLSVLGAAVVWACAAQTSFAASDSPPASAGPPTVELDSAPSEPEAPTDSRAVKELLRLAELERRAGNTRAEVKYLTQVIELDSAHCLAHARLAEITGPAPASVLAKSDDLVRLALQHPYDPKALVVGATALADRGRTDQAIEFLERAVWLADLDPSASLTAIRQLYEISDEWKHRRVVPVQLYVDSLIQAQPGWKFQMRNLWSSASVMLDSLLETRFVPIAFGSFDAKEASNDLDEIHAEFLAATRPPSEGIYASFTGRPVPDEGGVHKKGVAELLGRSLTVRIAPRAIRSRVLAHEILHLYGAIHVLEGVDSLMNPTGDSLALDAPNIRIVRALRDRKFGPGDIEQNVLPWIDLRATVAAYRAALSENLILRDAEIKEAMRAKNRSSDQQSFRVFQATYLDTHLADVARLVAALMLADGQRTEALRLLDLSSQLYGQSTPRGQAVAEKANRLRGSLEADGASAAE